MTRTQLTEYPEDRDIAIGLYIYNVETFSGDVHARQLFQYNFNQSENVE